MEDRLTFAGLTEPQTLPSAYDNLATRHRADHIGTLQDAVSFLKANYNAEWRDLYYDASPDPGDGHGMPAGVSNYKAVVNPDWVDGVPEGRDDPVWYVPTTKYTLVPHHESLSPLGKAIESLGEGDNVFGSVRTRRDGGEVHMDVFFQGADLDSGGDDDITLGISTGNDYYQNVSLYVDVIAFLAPDETDAGRVMRYLVDKKSRKHTGTAHDDIVTFYQAGVGRLETATDGLREVVGNAMHHEVELDEMPISYPEFYRYLDLPDRKPNEVATPAGDRANRITPPGENPTAWHLYKAGMWAMENVYDSRDTATFKRHISTVNTLLFNPSLAEKRVLSSIEDDLLEAKSEDDHELTDFSDSASTVDEELSTVRTRAKRISEGVEEFENVRERISKLLTDTGTEEVVDPDGEKESAESDDTDDTEDASERAVPDGGIRTLDEW